ncbi:MAG: hypothetical protein GX624_04780 [Actinobacteria bacterium]|jgi:hypothetical protein|nr:hypothetical protein [Actinomycetota bacterium]
MNEQHHDAIACLRHRVCAAVEPEDFAAAARDAKDLLAAAEASPLTRPSEVRQLRHIHRALVRAVGLAVLRRILDEGRP